VLKANLKKRGKLKFDTFCVNTKEKNGTQNHKIFFSEKSEKLLQLENNPVYDNASAAIGVQ
jgi:hypothetical protein